MKGKKELYLQSSLYFNLRLYEPLLFVVCYTPIWLHKIIIVNGL